MKTYYCHECARKQGFLPSISVENINLTGNQYLFEKFEKHTKIPTESGFTSVYDDPTYQTYKDYTVSCRLSGCLEIDGVNRMNLIWYVGEEIGVTYDNQNIYFSNDTVKVVLPQNTGKMHSYPVDSQNYLNSLCFVCGMQIVT